MPNKNKNEFICPATFVRDEKGYLLPIYPKNPTQEVRNHILHAAEQARGMRPNEMSLQQVWCVNAATRLRIDALQQQAVTKEAPPTAVTATTTPHSDTQFKAMMAKVIAPAV